MAGARPEAGRPCRHVVLITIDCLRFDHFGPRFMPRTFKLLGEGARFNWAFSQGPYTPPSFMSIMTSTYPLMYDGYPRLSHHRTALAEVLQQHGLLTCAVHHNPFLARHYGFHRGFTYFEDFSGLKDRRSLAAFLLRHPKAAFYSAIRKVLLGFTVVYLPARIITDYAIACLRHILGGPGMRGLGLFLWVHYMDVHHPFTVWPPKGTTIRRMRHVDLYGHKMGPEYREDAWALYGQSLLYIDRHLGRLLAFLDGAGILDDALTIITADHGEEFFEHGGFGHQAKLYNELLHVPLLIHPPELTEGCDADGPVGLIDLAPTVLDALGLPRGRRFLGSSILGGRGRSYVISECGSRTGDPCRIDIKYHQFAITTKRWKLIYRPFTRHAELYDLKHDPLEKENVADEHEDIVKALTAVLKRHRRMELASNIKARAARAAGRGKTR